MIHLLIEYFLLPAAFIFVPRLNQYIIERSSGTQSDFFDKDWHWPLEVAIAFFLAYILLVFRLDSDGKKMGIFSLTFVPILGIAVLVTYYVNRASGKVPKILAPGVLCFIFGAIQIVTIVGCDEVPVADLCVNFLANNSSRILKWGFFASILAYLIGRSYYGVKQRKERTKSSISAYQDFDVDNLPLKEVFDKFREFENSYGIDNEIAINYLMQKITILKNKGYRLSAIQEIVKVKESKKFQSVSDFKKLAILKFQFDLLYESNEFYMARDVMNEMENSPVKDACRTVLEPKLRGLN